MNELRSLRIRHIAARVRRSETPVRNATQNYDAFPQRTVRAPISRAELDESSYDTAFVIAELSDAIRRGVCYFSLGGRPLDYLNSVINALVDDGEIAYGGNVAIDAARTCLRLGCAEVTIAYRRTRAEMPADVEEVEKAEDEGIHMSFLTIPKAVVGKDGRLTGLECIRAKLIKKDDSERLFPVPVEGSDFILEADTVISAIGQRIDLECLSYLKGLKWTRRQTIQTKIVSMETTIAGVFAGGDAVTGPATVVEAIGAGKRAAEAIDRYLSGIPQPKMPPVPVRRSRVEWMEVPASTKMTLRRPEMPQLNLEPPHDDTPTRQRVFSPGKKLAGGLRVARG